MKKILLFTLAVFSGLITLAQKQFELKGTIEPSFNAKYVYLYGIDWSKLNPEINDSCLVKNGKFTFKGKLYTPGLLVSLYAKGVTGAFVQLYIQPGAIDVNLKGKGWNRDENVSLRNASIHNQYQKLKALTGVKEFQLAMLRYRIDSLRNRHPDSTYDDLKILADSLNQQVLQLRKQFIQDNQGDYMSLVVLSYFLWGRIELDEIKTLYAGLSNSIKDLQEGKSLLEKIKRLDAMQIGKSAPNFTLLDTNGNVVKLSQFKGCYVLLDFWASWCQPCLQQVPALKAFHSRNKEKNLRIIGISLDENKAKWLSAIEKYSLNWQHVSDLKGWKSIICLLYNVDAIPKNILMGPDGKIIGIDVNLENCSL